MTDTVELLDLALNSRQILNYAVHIVNHRFRNAKLINQLMLAIRIIYDLVEVEN